MREVAVEKNGNISNKYRLLNKHFYICTMQMNIHNNLKILRKRIGYTQQELADICNISRSKIAGYELHTQPTIESLILLSDALAMPIDVMLKEDLSTWQEFKFKQYENLSGHYVTGSNLRVLATSVNEENEELAEMVPDKARAGYLQAYADPDFISNLPKINLPMMSKNKKYRAFQVSGDSMPPLKNDDWVVCSYVDNWLMLKDGDKYVFVTDREGIILKTAYKKTTEDKGFLMVSSNPFYKPFYLLPNEIREVWRVEWWFTNSID
jgi:transcriptional regulator with XRE-family HTH domain